MPVTETPTICSVANWQLQPLGRTLEGLGAERRHQRPIELLLDDRAGEVHALTYARAQGIAVLAGPVARLNVLRLRPVGVKYRPERGFRLGPRRAAG